MKKWVGLIGIIALLMTERGMADQKTKAESEKATFAGGCFWCMQPVFDRLPGVVTTTVGYTGGSTKNPTYEEVSSGRTGHAEAIEILFDPAQISFSELLGAFWRSIDPTDPRGQFADKGSQYRTAIFYHNEEQKRQVLKSRDELAQSEKFDQPVVTEIVPAEPFYPAEEYHQKYYLKNAGHYNLYKIGSGREGFLKKMWGSK